MKKIMTLLIGILLSFSLIFTGCGGNGGDDDDTDEAMKEVLERVDFGADASHEGTLNIAINEEQSEGTIMDSFVSEFKKQYPKITVNITRYASAGFFTTLRNLHASAIKTGDYSKLPDVFWTAQDVVPEQATFGMLMPINFFDEADDNFTLGTLVDSMVQTATYNNRCYMMPRDYNQVTIYCNEDLFRKAGAEVPTKALTRTEFEALLAKFNGMTNEKGQKIYGLDAYWNWESTLWPLVKSFGGKLIDVDGDGTVTPALDSDETYNAYEMVKQWVLKGYTPEIGGAACGLFSIGRAAMTFHSRPKLPDLINEGYVTNMNAAPMPKFGEEYCVGAGSSGYGMYRYVQNPTEAWLFLKSIVSEDSQNAFCDTGAGIPIVKSMLDDENASFRKYECTGLSDSFNHEAFVYDYKTASCTPYDYKQYLPFSTLKAVMGYFQDSITKAVNSTTATNYNDPTMGIHRYLKNCDKQVAKELAKA